MHAPAQPTRMMRPQPRPKSGSMLPLLMLGGLLTAGMLMLLCGVIVASYVLMMQDRIPAGVTVAGVPVGGKSVEKAALQLQQSNPRSTVLLQDGSRSWSLSLQELGISIDFASTAQAAQRAQKNTEVQPRYLVDLNQTQNGLVSLSNIANIAAVPGETPQQGRSVDIPVMLERLRVNLTGELADGVLDLPMIVVEPPPLESINRSDTTRTTHVVERGQELGLIARMYGVSVEDILAVNEIADPDILIIGQELTIPAAGLYQPTAADAPIPSTNAGKAIVVSVSEQRIYAYENGEMIRSHIVSTGLPATPTVLGDFKVYLRYVADDMQGEDYFLPQVPYTMYFYQGYAIHGTYWHNSFGRPMSHGCVNLPVEEAQWFFEWAEMGTPVRVIA